MMKPSRKDLLLVVSKLQDVVGRAMAANNDRNPNRFAATDYELQLAHHLCVFARSDDPPVSQNRRTSKWIALLKEHEELFCRTHSRI